MRYVINNSKNPYFNLALEEYCLKHIDVGEDYFMLWQNKPSVIIGKNQNTLQEISTSFVDERKIYVARRISGGGAVYHDLGNLNYTFIGQVENLDQVDFQRYAEPIIRALRSMGVEAQLSGRNDITVDGKKISGNAQRFYKNRVMQHGTLMFDVNLEDLTRALTVGMDKIESKGIQSVRSRVTNIKDHLKEPMSITDFQQRIERELSDNYRSEEIKLSREALDTIQSMAINKFSTWDWNYGNSPEFNISNGRRFPGGKVQVLLQVVEGKIHQCRFLGDYLGLEDVEPVENALKGVRYDGEALREVLGGLVLKRYFGNISQEELMQVLWS